MRVFEVLTRDVAAVLRDEPLIDAIRRMRDEHVGSLVVVEESVVGMRPVGMLTDRDIVVGVYARDDSHISVLDAGDVMTPDPVTATADEDLGEVLRRMRSFGVRRVPVVDAAGMLEGILSIDDAIAGLSEELSDVAALISQQREREVERRP